MDRTMWQWYGTKHLQLCPYMPSTPVYKDGMLPFLYTKLKEEGKVLQTFCDETKTLDSFVTYFDRIKTLQVLCDVTESNGVVPVGFSWVDMPRGRDGCRVAMGGMAFFDGASRRYSARNLAKLAMAYGFEALKIDIVQGLQDVRNIAGRNFFQRIGFQEDAVVHNHFSIDGEFVDARVLVLKKKDFWPGFLLWKQDQDSTAQVEKPVEALV